MRDVNDTFSPYVILTEICSDVVVPISELSTNWSCAVCLCFHLTELLSLIRISGKNENNGLKAVFF